MKIAFLNIYSGINHRGAESFSHSLGNHLSKQHFITSIQGGEKLEEQEYEVIKIKSKVSQPLEEISENLFKKICKYLFLDQANLCILLFTIKSIPAIFKRKFDLIIPFNGFWQVIILKLLQPFLRHKLIVIGNSGPGWDERWNLYLKPDRFIATTQSALDWANKTCFWTISVLIPYAIDLNYINNAQPVNIPLKKPIILCPSALVSYKRVELAIKATSHLTEANLLILGSGPLEKQMQKLGKKMLQERFLLSHVPYNKMPKYYKIAELVVLPSAQQENSPMVFLESLASGLQVVTTNSPRNRWLLENAGIYCDPQNIKSFSMSIRTGLKRAKEKSTRNSIKQAVDKFKWSKIEPAYDQLIKELFS